MRPLRNDGQCYKPYALKCRVEKNDPTLVQGLGLAGTNNPRSAYSFQRGDYSDKSMKLIPPLANKYGCRSVSQGTYCSDVLHHASEQVGYFNGASVPAIGKLVDVALKMLFHISSPSFLGFAKYLLSASSYFFFQASHLFSSSFLTKRSKEKTSGSG